MVGGGQKKTHCLLAIAAGTTVVRGTLVTGGETLGNETGEVTKVHASQHGLEKGDVRV